MRLYGLNEYILYFSTYNVNHERADMLNLFLGKNKNIYLLNCFVSSKVTHLNETLCNIVLYSITLCCVHII